MPWNTTKGQARYEVIFTDRELHDHVAERAARAGMSVAIYLQTLARAEYLLSQGDLTLISLLGIAPPAMSPLAAAAPPPEPAPASPPRDTRLVDRQLDALGL